VAEAPTPMSMEELGERLQGYLARELARTGLVLSSVTAIPEGHSGFTYFVTASDSGWRQRMVLRLPPPGARIAGPADVLRQGRVMAALFDHGLPTPRIIANCDDPGVLDGRPFCLMEAVEGDRVERALVDFPPIQLAAAAVATLKRIQAVPLDQTGLAGEAPTSLDEEMMRWAWLMQRAPEELTARAPELGSALAARKPADPGPTLVHGDYHYGNLLFRRGPGGEAEVAAVLDWEIAELGAPAIDLGCLCVVAQRNRSVPGAPNPGGGIDLEIDEVIGLYGADPGESRWYLALSCYKYASIFGYNLMLHRRGKRPDAMYEGLTEVIMALVDSGLEMLA
jgi:aminoglycoside phosphotransferase (APT) family kinase protein